MGGKEPLCGLAFIVEGPTEKVFLSRVSCPVVQSKRTGS